MNSARIVWATHGIDAMVARIARVSNPSNENNDATAAKLLRYLIRNAHWSPFEMASVCMEFRTTRDIARQVIRHRSFVFQEFSQRYAKVPDLPVFREARMQHPTNRQASIPCASPDLEAEWMDRQSAAHHHAREAYRWAIKHGIAKEQARAVLPEGLTPSRLYVSGTLRSWMHYCGLRMGNGTQQEHAELAASAWQVVRDVAPICAAAFDQEQEQERNKE
jgi:thymidylate synthase (FAD)